MSDGVTPQELNPMTVPRGIPAVEAAAHRPQVEAVEVVVITGASGAGRTQAASVLEDLRWFVVDNLPPNLLLPLVELVARTDSSVRRLAVVLDVRGGEFFDGLLDAVDELRRSGVSVRMLFLKASTEALVRRFEAVRRPHPLSPHGRILHGIEIEKKRLVSIEERADAVIDTSDLSTNELAREVRAVVAAGPAEALRINIVSFGFKHGLPLDADHVVDVRFLKNPYWITELRHLNGRDKPVRDYVLGQDGALEFVTRYASALEPALAGYTREEKRYVTIAVGCTGGQHRSVAVSEELAGLLRNSGHLVTVAARDLGRE